MLKVREIIFELEKIAPPRLADEGDKIGLQVGSYDADVTKVAVAVDPSVSVIDRAVDSGCELLVCHHPLIYTPLETLAAGEPTQDKVIKLIEAGTSLYVMHTNYDSAPGGVNDILAERLGVHNTRLLVTRHRERYLKIAVFTPSESIDVVRNAMAEAGAGIIGNYDYCSFRTAGTGTFRPLPDAQPYIGEVGQLEEVDEYRLEMIVPEWRLGPVVDAMIQAHPYEEVAYDVYRLENPPRTYGYGRVGQLDDPIKLKDYRKLVEDALDYRETRMVGDPERQVKVVAVMSGSGRRYLSNAVSTGADVYITGDMGHHDMDNAEALGLAVIDVGHYASERPAMEVLAENLSQKYAETTLQVVAVL